ncbi:MAG: discoidin domain-containing protein [Oscillospiraceae bacterium]|jgi:hypothetical protein|nr:discoidin domain-containing protein [Oscillospiraceae bacterium]
MKLRKILAVFLAVTLLNVPFVAPQTAFAANAVNLAAGKAVSSSGNANASWVAQNLTDGNYNNGWSSAAWNGPTGHAWCRIDLGADTQFNAINILARNYQGIVCYPVSFMIEAITDSGTSIVLVNKTDAPTPTVDEPWAEYTFDTVTARYVYLTATKVNAHAAGTYHTQLMELEIYFTGLDALLAEALTLEENQYSPASWLTLQNAIAAAQKTLSNPSSTEEELQRAYDALQSAINADLMMGVKSVNIKVGDSVQITVEPPLGVEWSSSNSTVASVDQTGLVTGHRKGSAVITAERGGIKRTCTVTVKSATTETLANGYEIDMSDLPKVSFPEHPEWEEIYDAAWQMHKSNIKKAELTLNPEGAYYMDPAFDGGVYAWDTMFMMLFDRWGYNQFPTLSSLDNFYYYTGADNEGKAIGQIAGTFSSDVVSSDLYYDNSAPWAGDGIFGKPAASTAKSPQELKSLAFVETLNAASGAETWALDSDNINDGFPIFAASPATVQSPVSFGGDGTEANPIQITSTADLETLALRVNSGEERTAGKYYLLTNDITLTGVRNHTPIGIETAGREFAGTFDGGGHTISGIRIYTSDATQGLFGYISGGTVKNLGVIDAVIESGIKSGSVGEPGANSGAIAGQAKNGARIVNCFSRGAYVHVKNAAASGIVGLLQNNSVIENCYAVGFMAGSKQCSGGIVGFEQGGENTVKNCYASGEVLYNGFGYIPRGRYQNGSIYTNWDMVTGLNPPLWAWAEWDTYKISGDISRFSKVINGRTIYQRLIDHFKFIERERKVENGLYGKTSGDSNGFDDTPNQDYPWILPTAGKGEQTYNDLSMQQAQQAYYLALIANEQGDVENYEYFTQRHAQISGLINELMWDEEAEMYSNLAPDGVTHTNISTPTNLWALIARVAPPERAEKIIKAHGLNSEKLFRPNGLATSAYDFLGNSSGASAFSPKGKYWNGSVWSPSSYQWMRGLTEMGYSDIAFNEAVRHVNMLSDVYKKIAGGAFGNSIWECYSPDYLRPATVKNDAGIARSNFVGWTGALSIGLILDNLLGLDICAPRNIINWTPRLTEANAVSNLWYSTDGVTNRVDISAEKRLNADASVVFTVKSERAFTLNIDNAGVLTTLEVEAGEHQYVATGPNTLQKAPALSISVDPINAGGTIQKSIADENAIDYVIFSQNADTSVKDGIKYQQHKFDGHQIYNVNTIGYRNASKRSSAQMVALGYADASEIVKTPYNSETADDGFMIMAEAGNGARLLKAVVGVKNTSAVFTARLSDASAARISRTLEAGSDEQTYIVNIPFRAASEDQYVYIEYRIPHNSASDSEISLKGIFLEDVEGVPSALVNVSAVAGDGVVILNASDPAGETNDNYVVYVAVHSGERVRYETDSLPFTLTELQNFSRHTVFVAGMKDGVEGILTSAAAIPEPDGTTDIDRAAKDLALTLPYILDDNKPGEVRMNLFPTVRGVLYGSTFVLQSATDGEQYGLSNDGTVRRSLLADITTTVVIAASLKGVTASRTLTLTIPQVDLSSEPYVVGEAKAPISGVVNLTALGDIDWVQFATQYDTDYAKKAVRVPEITNITHINSSYTEVAGDAPFTYTYTDAMEGTQPGNNKSIVSKDLGNGLTFNLPGGPALKKVTVCAGVYNGTAQVELLINGVSLYKDSIRSATTGDHLPLNKFRYFEMNYSTPNPYDIVLVQVTLTEDKGRTASSLVVPFVTLSDKGILLTRPTVAEGIAYTPVSGEVNLTELGDIDWVQFATRYYTDYAKKAVSVPGITNITHIDNSYTEVAGDAPFTYTYTDAAAGTQPGNSKSIVSKDLGNGLTFNLPGGPAPKKVTVCAGVFNGTVQVELLINGVSKYKDSVRSTTTGDNLALYKFRFFEISYLAPNPDDVVLVSVTLTEDYGRGRTSLVLPFAALSADGTLSSSYGVRASVSEDGAKGAYSIFNAKDEALDVLCILAAYDADGRLVNVSRKTLGVDPWGFGDQVVELPSDGAFVRAFLWDANTLAPLSAAARENRD